MDLFTHELNPPQIQAVNSLDGPLLILAGAGSGKTRVLTYRTANLILKGKARLDEILAVTFTNKAAREMASRILSLLHKMNIPVFDRPWISTFHSTCARILRENLYLLDYQPGWGIYDSGDQLSMAKKVIQAMGMRDKEFPAKSLIAKINFAKRKALEPQQVCDSSEFIMDETSLEAYTIYEQEMKKSNNLDFSDLLFKTHQLFKDYPALLEEYQNRFRYLMVDEYQDTNHIQYLLVKQLASKNKNICVVGDEDQSIYSWRGADISNILNFEEDFNNCTVIKLEENYRSTKNIISAATAVIQNNSERKDKTLFTNNPSGDKITISELTSEYDEARFLVNEIDKCRQGKGYNYSDFAVFYRTNNQSRVIEEQLRGRSIPYRIVGGIKFYERKEIKDVMSYLKVLVNPSDDISLKRIVNVPARGIGKTTVEKLEVLATERNISLLESIPLAAAEKTVHSGAAKKLLLFSQLIKELSTRVDDLMPTELYHEVLKKTAIIDRLRADDSPESAARIDNLEELANGISQFEKEQGEEATLIRFLEEMSLISDIDDIDDSVAAVTLMTLHISKGLEYPCVFIIGLEEGLFPSARSFDDNMEEERRLAYVGMTRAMETLYLSHARKRKVWGQEQFNPPSRFLSEIPDEYLSRKSSVGKPKFLDRYYNEKYGGSNSQESSFDAMPGYEDFSDDCSDNYSDNYSIEDESSFSKGMKVRHPSYGAGSVFKVEGRGETQKVSVMFNNRMVKKFVVKFARLERI